MDPSFLPVFALPSCLVDVHNSVQVSFVILFYSVVLASFLDHEYTLTKRGNLLWSCFRRGIIVTGWRCAVAAILI